MRSDPKITNNPDPKNDQLTKKEKMKERDRKRRERKKEERKKERQNGKSVEEIAEEVESMQLEDDKNSKKINPDTAGKKPENSEKKKKEKEEKTHKKSSKKAQELAEQNPTKVIIRNIPPFVTSSDFLDIIKAFLPENSYYNFCVADQSLVPWHTATAYFNFQSHESVKLFFSRWNNFTFPTPEEFNNLPSEYRIQVEIAPFQKLPSDKSSEVVDSKENIMDLKKEMGLSGKIFNSLEFNRFLKKDKKEAKTEDSQAKLEQFMQDMEARKSAMDSSKKSTEIFKNKISIQLLELSFHF